LKKSFSLNSGVGGAEQYVAAGPARLCIFASLGANQASLREDFLHKRGEALVGEGHIDQRGDVLVGVRLDLGHRSANVMTDQHDLLKQDLRDAGLIDGVFAALQPLDDLMCDGCL